MTDQHLESLKSLYAGVSAPVIILSDSLERLWANDSAQENYPVLFGSGIFSRRYMDELIKQLNHFGAATYTPNQFPVMHGSFMLVKNGSYVVAVAAPPVMQPAPCGIDVDGLDQYNNIIRSAVDGITLSSQTVERAIDADDPEVSQPFSTIRHASYRILRNIQNATLLSRYTAGRLVCKKENCSLNVLLSSISLAAKSICKVPFHINLSAPAQDIVTRLDIRLLERALLNILLNAMVYTRDGNEIDITLTQSGGQIIITVRDRGAGIQARNLPHVKEPYFSCEPADDGGPRPGLGLGLSVAAIFCHLHGGTLMVNSEFGEGTRVAMSMAKVPAEVEDTFMASIADYVTNAFSPVYVEMCDICEIPK